MSWSTVAKLIAAVTAVLLMIVIVKGILNSFLG